MKLSVSGLNFIKKWEGLNLSAYLCPASIPTIGWGTTFYEDGKPVKMGDNIDKKRAEELLMNVLMPFEKAINNLDVNLRQNQFDALVSFSYNVGLGALKRSTLLKMILNNPDDINIKEQFLRWNKHRKNGKLHVSQGLTNRRAEEANMYMK